MPQNDELPQGQLQVQQGQSSVYDYLCEEVNNINMDPRVKLGLKDVCRWGRLDLIDASPGYYVRGSDEPQFISVFVRAGPRVIVDSIKVFVEIENTGMEKELAGSGDGVWRGVFYDPSGNGGQQTYQMKFRATWEAKPKNFDMRFSRSTSISVKKDIYGPGRLWSCSFYSSDYYPTECLRREIGIFWGNCPHIPMVIEVCNYLPIDASPIIIHGYKIYCKGQNGDWRPSENTDHWTILDWQQQQLSFPISLSSGEAVFLGLACNYTFEVGLLVIQTSIGDFFRKIEPTEVPVG